MKFERRLFVSLTAEISAPDDRVLCDAVVEAIVKVLATDGGAGNDGCGAQVDTPAGVVTVRQSVRNEYWQDGQLCRS